MYFPPYRAPRELADYYDRLEEDAYFERFFKLHSGMTEEQKDRAYEAALATLKPATDAHEAGNISQFVAEVQALYDARKEKK